MTSIGEPRRERVIQPDVVVVPPLPAREPAPARAPSAPERERVEEPAHARAR